MYRFLVGALVPVAALAFAPQSNAGTIVLGPGTVSISPAQSFTVISTPGTYHFIPPGTNAPTDATALFGSDPNISLAYSSNGGDAQVLLDYQLELVPLVQSSTPPSPVAVPITMADTVSAPLAADPFFGRADAQIKISFNASNPLWMENCAGNTFAGCSYGGAFTTTPFAAVTSVSLVPGTIYTLEMRADVAQSGFASIDPVLTAPAGYALVYSPGVVGAVPEPGSWAMMLIGLGGIGLAMRYRRHQLIETA